MEKNRISNISTARFHHELRRHIHHTNFFFLQTHSNIGYVVILCLNLSVLLPLADNPKVNNYTLVLCVHTLTFTSHIPLTSLPDSRTNSYWVLIGIWWCESNFLVSLS